jgi:hypothetical protein
VVAPSRSRGPAYWAAALFGLCAVIGCGTQEGRLSTRPVTGKAALDGKPLAGAEIWLVPKSPEVANAKMTVRPYAKTGADGTFKLTSYVADDGAPIGDYTVIVQKTGGTADADDPDADPENPPSKGKPKTFAATVAALKNSRLPAKYSNPTTSDLTFTVKDGPNQLDFDLKSK